jgi:hypothetical protein
MELGAKGRLTECVACGGGVPTVAIKRHGSPRLPFREFVYSLVRKPGRIEVALVCRNIKPLFNFEPPVNDEEIRDASLQFVRKISGFNRPSKANETVFFAAATEIAAVSSNLLRSLATNAPPRDRTEEAIKARARAARRFPSEKIDQL